MDLSIFKEYFLMLLENAQERRGAESRWQRLIVTPSHNNVLNIKLIPDQKKNYLWKNTIK
jgi:hypothetical protein